LKENCEQKEMRAGNDGGYRLDFHIQSFVITDEKKKRKKFLFSVVLKKSQKGVYAQRHNLYL
jgi:hypothetical protein